jgi:hypothetical protein
MRIPRKMLFLVISVLIVLVAVFAAGLSSPDKVKLPASATHPPPSNDSVRFAVIGDYGWDGTGEAQVAALVHYLNPDLILTVGDNNYPNGASGTFDQKVGKYYHDFIAPYPGRYGNGSEINRFFPSPGNHDWGSGSISSYLDYFTLPETSGTMTSRGDRSISSPWIATPTSRTG